MQLKTEGKLQPCVYYRTYYHLQLTIADFRLFTKYSDGAYVQFLKPHGNLVNNLKALDRVAAA